MAILKIHNFGPVQDATVQIRRFNFFIGEQSVGKSTIAKLITIFTDYVSLAFLCDDKEGAWRELLASYDLSVYAESSDYAIEYISDNSDFYVDVKIDDGKVDSKVLSSNGTEMKTGVNILNTLIQRKKLFNTEHIRDVLSKEVPTEDMRKLAMDNMRNSLYIPAERIVSSLSFKLLPALMLSKEQIPQNLLRFITEQNNAKAKYPELPINLLDVTYKIFNNNEYIELADGKLVPLRNASSGIQSALPLVQVIKYCTENMQYESFVVEEPECNLFPQKQVQLLELLISTIYNTERTLTITTHSPYLLSAMNNYLYASLLSDMKSEEGKKSLAEVIDSHLWIKPADCSIYSLGNDINGGEYCKSITDEKTGLIDFNYLDGVSMSLSEQFSRMQDIKVKELRKSHKAQ